MSSATHPPVTQYDLKLALPLAGLFALFFIAPLVLLIIVSFYTDTSMTRFGLDQYARFLLDPFSLGVLGSTLWLGVKVTALCFILGFPLAWIYVRAPRWAQGILMLVVVLPLLTSVVVRTFSWIVILGRQGIINNTLLGLGLIDAPLRLLYTEGGVVWALAQVQMPLMVLPLITALSRIEPNLEDASAALGAGAWRTFFRVTLPLSLPGIIAGCLLTFAASITAFITQSLVGGGRMLFMPMYLYQQSSTLNNWPFAAAISVIFLIAVLGAVTLFNFLGRLARGTAEA
ncbi:MAG: ABC transporter permease [Rhizobiales bacterium PAR1]|nr:MAG: ABC transporter permease [Rhizobiales bacterium PAR1]